MVNELLNKTYLTDAMTNTWGLPGGRPAAFRNSLNNWFKSAQIMSHNSTRFR